MQSFYGLQKIKHIPNCAFLLHRISNIDVSKWHQHGLYYPNSLGYSRRVYNIGTAQCLLISTLHQLTWISTLAPYSTKARCTDRRWKLWRITRNVYKENKKETIWNYCTAHDSAKEALIGFIKWHKRLCRNIVARASTDVCMAHCLWMHGRFVNYVNVRHMHSL